MSVQPCAFQSLKTVFWSGKYGFGIDIEPVERIFFAGSMIPSARAPIAKNGFTTEPGV